MDAKEAQQWEDILQNLRKPEQQCDRLVVNEVPLFCFPHSDAEQEDHKREEDEHAATVTLEWHRKKFPSIPAIFLPFCKSWQDWMMHLLKPVCRHYGVSDETVLRSWTKHYGYGLFLQYRVAENLKPGEPCGHSGCLAHISHPCDGCGRTGGMPRE